MSFCSVPVLGVVWGFELRGFWRMEDLTHRQHTRGHMPCVFTSILTENEQQDPLRRPHRAPGRPLRRTLPLHPRPQLLHPRPRTRHHHARQLRLLRRPRHLPAIQGRRPRERRRREHRQSPRPQKGMPTPEPRVVDGGPDGGSGGVLVR